MEKSTDSDGEDKAKITVWFGCHICCIRYFPDTDSLIKHKVEDHSPVPTKCTRSSVAKIKDCFNLRTTRSKKVDLLDVIEEKRKMSRKPYPNRVNGNKNKTEDVPSSASSKSKRRERNSNTKLRQDIKMEIKQEDVRGENPIFKMNQDSFTRVEHSSSSPTTSINKNRDKGELYIIKDEEVIVEKVVPAVMNKKKQEDMNKTEITCITLCSDDDSKNNDDTKRDDVKLSPIESDQIFLTKQNKSKNGNNNPRPTKKRKNSTIGDDKDVGCYARKLRKRVNSNPNQYPMNVKPESSSIINLCVI